MPNDPFGLRDSGFIGHSGLDIRVSQGCAMTNAIALIPRTDVVIRLATSADIPFMDGLQKAHSKQLGYFPTKQFESYIDGGHVLVAESLLEVGGSRLDETSNPQ